MGRLNGGELLIDLTKYGALYTDVTQIRHPLSDEEIECIKSKGLDIKVNFAGHIIVWNLPLREYIQDADFFGTRIYVNGGDYAIFTLNTDDKRLDYDEI